MKSLIHSIGITIFISYLSPSIAGERDPAAEACYEATQRAISGVTITQRDIKACNKALTRGPHTQAHKSTVYHNRGMLELAMGSVDEARQSMERAVELAEDTGIQHLALAQLAHKQGDLLRASELYEEILGDESPDSLVASQLDAVERNRALLQLQQRQVAKVSGVGSASADHLKGSDPFRE